MTTEANLQWQENADINDTTTMSWPTVNVTDVKIEERSGELTELAAKITMASYVVVPLFAVLGIVGNAFTLVIMRQPYFRKSSTSIHLSALAISDATYSFVNPFTKSFMKDLFTQDPKTLSKAGCKLFFSMLRNAKIISSWIVVLICVERFVVIWFPLRVKRINTRKVAIWAVAFVVVTFITFNTIWSIEASGLVGDKCLPSVVKAGNEDIITGLVVAGTAVYNIIPTVILLLLTPLTIFKLVRQMSWRRRMNTTTGNEDSARVTRMIIAVTVAYIILVTPISTAHSVAFFQGDDIFESTNPSFIIFREFAQTVEQFNYSINFLLYVTFNASFRRAFCMLIGCRGNNRAPQQNNQNLMAVSSGNKKSDSMTDSTITTDLSRTSLNAE